MPASSFRPDFPKTVHIRPQRLRNPDRSVFALMDFKQRNQNPGRSDSRAVLVQFDDLAAEIRYQADLGGADQKNLASSASSYVWSRPPGKNPVCIKASSRTSNGTSIGMNPRRSSTWKNRYGADALHFHIVRIRLSVRRIGRRRIRHKQHQPVVLGFDSREFRLQRGQPLVRLFDPAFEPFRLIPFAPPFIGMIEICNCCLLWPSFGRCHGRRDCGSSSRMRLVHAYPVAPFPFCLVQRFVGSAQQVLKRLRRVPRCFGNAETGCDLDHLTAYHKRR